MNFIGIAIICIGFLSVAAANGMHTIAEKTQLFGKLSEFLIYFFQSKLIIVGRYDGRAMMCVINLNSSTPAYDTILGSDLSFCTHLICSDSSMESTTGFEWTQDQRKQYKKCVNTRTRYPYLKIFYSVEKTASEYSEIASDSKQRQKFIKTVFNIVSRNNFDGLNLNWQYSERRPAADTFKSTNRKTQVLLVKELNEALKSNNLLLSTTFHEIQHNLTIEDLSSKHGNVQLLEMFDFVSISKYVDYLVIESNEEDGLIKSGVSSKKLVTELTLKQFMSDDKIGQSLDIVNRELVAKNMNNVNPKLGLAGIFVDVSFRNPLRNENKSQLEIMMQNMHMDNLVQILLQNIKAVVMLLIEIDRPRKNSLKAYNKAINRMTEKIDQFSRAEINSAMQSIKSGFKIYQQGLNLYSQISGNRIMPQMVSSALAEVLFKEDDETEIQNRVNIFDGNTDPFFKAELNSAVEHAKDVFEIVQLYMKTFSIIDWNESRKKSLNAYSIGLNKILDKIDPCSDTEINSAMLNIKYGLKVCQQGLNMYSGISDTNEHTTRSMPFSMFLSKAIDKVIEN
ncbi:uncharacterized protein LOC129577118 [Sitodiplosis mosellana]|uniref:uncharacterized protein LOC129577118 n=1 Tax=Sitodiplosis mosellana TaxID=263140 RepID=UPI002443CA2D|nr:uncharacterized protein LOC129577118 [Sitodiplosis mosellana]